MSVARAPADLTPYVPRVTLEWLRTTPEATYRELDGTMVFLDISGFTSMSERLAQRGKVGAEELTEVMNATFTSLLDVAYARGGGLLKFGGDALLLFFSGSGHAGAGCRAAFEMRRVLREVGRPQTSAGQVTLRMHVGIHSGSFQFYLVGDSHRELIVTGPNASRTVDMEATAEAGEIAVSRETAAALAPAQLGDAKGEGFLLKGAPPATGELYPLPDTAGLDLALAVPAPIRDHLTLARAESEHRQATVAFLKFTGTDAMLADEGAEAVAAALDELARVTQQAAGEHDVCFLESDIDRDGGKLVLVAGAPTTSGGDEERMLRTVRAIADARPRLPLQIGVNRGRVFAGEVGAPFRRTYTILGDTAALGARLMARARPGQILVSADVLERAGTRFETDPLEPFQVKGRAEPVTAHVLGALAGSKEVEERRRLPLVDRERERAVLGASLAPVRAGFGTLVELVGEPGIGKSRLVDDVREQTADMTFVSARCEQYESSTPYYAFRDLLRGLVAADVDGDVAENTRLLTERVEQLDPELVPWIPLLALPLDVDVEPTREAAELEPSFRRARLNGVVATLMAKLLASPSVLVFEDVHWMDEASSDLLRHLGTQLATRPWFTCATRRPIPGGFSAAEGTPPLPALTLRLEPLLPDDAKELVAAATNGALGDADLESILERGAGNPLFLEELVAASATTVEGEELPETVEAVVTTRIDQLAPGDRALLRWASVLGMSFSADLIADVLEEAEAAADSEAWDRLAEFVERDPDVPRAFRFRHAVIRDAAYAGLSYRRRRELHARVGEAYEARYGQQAAEFSELLSLHFLRAEAFDKAWTYALAAGESARAKWANVEAADFFRRALEAARSLPDLDSSEVAIVWESLGDVSELTGVYGDAEQAYRQARRLAADDRQPALLMKEGVIRERSGRYSEALRWYTRGLRAAEALADEAARAVQLAELKLAYAGVRFRQGRLTDCIEWCHAAVEDATSVNHMEGLAHAYYLLHLAYTSLGRPERKAFRGLALPIYEELGDLLGQANVLNNLGIDAYYEGRWDEALRLYERSREFRVRIGDVVGAATITNNIAEIKSDQGHFAEAEELFSEARDVCDAAGYRLVATLAASNLGRAEARAGRLDDAEDVLRRALESFREMDAAAFVVETEGRLAEVALARGDATAALALAQEALEHADDATGVVRVMLDRLCGLALLAAGDLDGAGRHLAASLGAARALGAEFEAALTLKALAEHSRRRGGDDSAELEREADAIFERLGVVETPPLLAPRA